MRMTGIIKCSLLKTVFDILCGICHFHFICEIYLCLFIHIFTYLFDFLIFGELDFTAMEYRLFRVSFPSSLTFANNGKTGTKLFQLISVTLDNRICIYH